jgi:hypothetical protein
LPTNGLFQGQTWRTATQPFALPSVVAKDLASLGRVLLQFYRAVNLLYRKSLEGKQPGWIAALLDQGKPASLLEWQRHPGFRSAVPRVIRPDLLLTDGGLSMTELDSVPGGIGLTAWLNQTYSREGFEVLGGERRMVEGFQSIFGPGRNRYIVVSREASSYRPEMEWIARQPGLEGTQVVDESYHEFPDGASVYRFFELFDLPNIPCAPRLFDRAARGELRLTPPPKAVFEEKLLFALLHNRHLQTFWRQELGDGFFRRLLAIVPRSWVIDPTPLPPHAAFPGLELTDWQQLKLLSQRERDLILKVSGFSDRAWGARSVHLGSDLSQADWAAAVDQAIREFPASPWVLQTYQKPAVVHLDYLDFDTDTVVRMPGRVRLCPYYFVEGDGDSARANLGGVLATVCPANKKIIHGMSEAVLAPCSA